MADLTCPECCGPKDTPITYTFCFRCSEAKTKTANPLRPIIDERDELRAHNDHLRATMSRLLIFARGNDHVLGIIHDAIDWRPATGEDAP